MTTWWQDLRFAGRMLRKSRGFTAIALITLAIGIGANTIMFSVVNALLFRPLHVKKPDELVQCGIRNINWLTYATYANMRDDNPAFSDLVAHSGGWRGTWVRGDVVRQMDLMYVSANYFSALGVAPAYGRTFLPEEERYGAEPVVVLSYKTWERQGADPGIVGQFVNINAKPCRIVGVTPKGFTGTSAGGPDAWLPLGAFGVVAHYDGERPTGRIREIWDYPQVVLVGRLKPGLDMLAAEARLQALVPRLKESNPGWWRKGDSKLYLAPLARLGAADGFRERRMLSSMSLVLMGISGAVLLIACLNLANMITVQGALRQREIAIRMAIGGGRLRIIRQLFLESLLLALCGGVLALLPAFWGVRILNAWLATGTLPIQLVTYFDVRVLGATLGFCLVAAVLSGLRPALRLSACNVLSDLKESGGGVVRSTRRRRRLVPRGLSVVFQIALSVVLMMIATLFTRTAIKAARANPGFDLAGKVVVQIDPLAAGYTKAQAMTACERLAERLAGIPGIQAVSLSTGFPVGDTRHDLSSRVVAYEPGVEDNSSKSLLPKPLLVFEVDGGYFQAMGIGLLRGRPFRPLDSAPGAERVVIIDEHLARALRPDGNAVDCLIQHGLGSELERCRVVGIVPSLRTLSGEIWEWSHLYQPLRAGQVPIYIHLRVAGTAPQAEAALVQSVGAQIRKIDPRLPVVSVTSLVDQHRQGSTVRQVGVTARLATMFGTMALFLAGLGLYAVKGHMVASRTPEIGIRMALGATRGDVVMMVFLQGAVSTFVGLSLGVLLAAALARVVRAGLHGISPLDPMSVASTMALLAVVSVLAGYVPARRAARIDPMEALRYE